MLCDSCGERDAVVQLTRIEGGEVKLLHLCERCAAENGVETSVPTRSPETTLRMFPPCRRGFCLRARPFNSRRR